MTSNCLIDGTMTAVFRIENELAVTMTAQQNYKKMNYYQQYMANRIRLVSPQGEFVLYCSKAESKLDEIRIVNKAKWFLIDHEGMSETDAHRYVEKSAMDAGITKRLAAQIIIDSYLE